MKTDSIFLQAFEGTNSRVPVWFMRQAGRYLPEYQAIRQKHHLNDMFRNPELAAEITCQPIDIIGVDAAILFADILTLPSAMGFDVHFDAQKGPVITALNSGRYELHDFDDLSFVAETIRLVNQRLPENIPLIGFAGSPFTVLLYLLEGGSSVSYFKTLHFLNESPQKFHALMEQLTRNTIAYLRLQKEAGIHAFQLFESWGGIIPQELFDKCVFPYVQQIFEAVDLPSIYFIRNAAHLRSSLEKIQADFLSLDHTFDFAALANQVSQGLQGNLFNGYLYLEDSRLKAETLALLNKVKGHSKYIFNLSHGVFPDVHPDKLKLVTETVHQFSW